MPFRLRSKGRILNGVKWCYKEVLYTQWLHVYIHGYVLTLMGRVRTRVLLFTAYVLSCLTLNLGIPEY